MNQVRFGLIGYGAWGSHHARCIVESPRAKLAAIAARSEATQAKARQDHPSAKVYGDFRRMLASEELDAVAIALPSNLHFEAAQASLEAGRHVLLEKPMALSIEHCDALNNLASRKGKLLAVGHELRQSSLWGKAKEMIDAGAIGEPRYCLIELWRKPYRLGADGWRYDINRVGNWILEEPIHFFDLARWYFSKAGDPVSVFAQASERRAEHPELQDNFSAFLRFGNGSYAVISQTLAGWEHHQIAKVTGREGALLASWSGAMDRTFEPTFSLRHQRGEAESVQVPVARMSGEVYELRDEFDHFTRAVLEGQPLTATGTDGKWSVAMCLKAQESVDTKREIQF
jgi:myo-inositol 2-dehydrogenase / D-chiro-inositol 1-dehydrogenase